MMTNEQLAAIRAQCEAARVTPPSYPGILELMPKHDREQFMKLWNAYQESQRAFHEAAREDIPALLDEVERVTAERDTARDEVERLRVDAELGRLVREGLPAIAQHSGDEAWLRYDHLDQMWGAGYTGYAEFSSCDPDNALETVLGDVLRKA